MAIFEAHLHSNELQKDTGINVVIPEGNTPVDELHVLWLLHGLSDDYTAWCRFTAIEDYARRYNTIVVMPDAEQSFYTDMVHGMKFYTYLTEELPKFMVRNFGISTARELNHIAGLSMGGFGAMKIALAQPERFCTVGTFSGSLDMADRSIRAEIPRLYKDIYGDDMNIKNTKEDLIYMLDKLTADGVDIPKIFLYCGTGDTLHEANAHFLAHCKKLGIPVKHNEDGGCHTWKYWNEQVYNYLAWIFGEEK